MKNRAYGKLFALFAVVFMTLAVSCPFLVAGASKSEWPIGDEWLYSYRDSYPYENYEGYMRYICAGKTKWESRSGSIDVIEFRSLTRGNISGDGFGFSLSGNFSIEASEYYDIATGAIVAFTYQQKIELVKVIEFEHIYWNYTESNITEYLPPGGRGFEPTVMEIGTIWHKNYSKYSYSNGSAQGVCFDYHSNYTEHVKYTFLGYESITVPAGSYYSFVIKGEYDDGAMSMIWYSHRADNFVRVLDYYPEGDMLEISLVKHVRFLQDRSDEVAFSPWGWLFFAFIGATAGAAISAGIIVRRRKRLVQTHPRDCPEACSPSGGTNIRK